ncbi:hypothetical protein I7I53_04033 [Histoplasma capsulatum var. duboisii H88]|uniref:Uncharacterized protein n=1 Tax=Ajellomyces capsulatus (strain H88) TaxID=544711 RepID=A0A8A1LQC1_AJEC8|nr:hypothetical protein I7I53_04033 [Histoplasma capsulatum var. duboisii H88]
MTHRAKGKYSPMRTSITARSLGQPAGKRAENNQNQNLQMPTHRRDTRRGGGFGHANCRRSSNYIVCGLVADAEGTRGHVAALVDLGSNPMQGEAL